MRVDGFIEPGSPSGFVPEMSKILHLAPQFPQLLETLPIVGFILLRECNMTTQLGHQLLQIRGPLDQSPVVRGPARKQRLQSLFAIPQLLLQPGLLVLQPVPGSLDSCCAFFRASRNILASELLSSPNAFPSANAQLAPEQLDRETCCWVRWCSAACPEHDHEEPWAMHQRPRLTRTQNKLTLEISSMFQMACFGSGSTLIVDLERPPVDCENEKIVHCNFES